MQVSTIPPEVQCKTSESMPSFFEQITPRESQIRNPVSGNLQCTTDVKRDKFKKYKLSQRSMSFYSEMEYSKRTSTHRYNADSNKQELSRFKKQAERMTDLNKARTNMLNWIQPDLIVTRSLMTLNRYFRKEVEHAFELIKGQEEDPELERSWLNDTDNNTFSEPAVKRHVAKFIGKKELNLYFSLDIILKKYLNKAFLNIQEYRHTNAVEKFEFQMLYFTKFTQTYAHYFDPHCVGTQTEDLTVFDPTQLKTKNLANMVETKLILAVKSGFLAIIMEAQNKDIQVIEKSINEKQRVINRQEEWANINERKKVDAQTKFFLTFMGGFFARKSEESILETFDLIEKENFTAKLKRIAIKNMVALSLRVLRVEFDRLREKCYEKPEQLKYDQASLMKGLFLLKACMRTIVEMVCKSTFSKVRLESRPRSRRSIMGMSRPPNMGGRDSNMGGRDDYRNSMSKMERISDGGEALRYICRKHFVENWRQMKVFYRFDEGFNQFRSKAFCIKMNNFFIKKRGFMFKLCKIYIERIEKIKQQSMSKLEFIENLFFRQEDAMNAFYIIKMSRNKRALSNHIKLGAILLNKISESMIARQVKQTFLEIKHDSNMGLMNIALSIFRTGSVYKSNSALDSEIQLMPQSDLQGDDNSVNDDFEGGKGFMSFGKYPDLSQADAGLLESPNSPAVDKGFSLNINKITSLNAQAQKVKPSPRGSKFGPIENRTAINPSLTKISPRQGELLSDNKGTGSGRSLGGDSKASKNSRKNSKFVPPETIPQQKRQSTFVNSSKSKVSMANEPKSATMPAQSSKRR